MKTPIADFVRDYSQGGVSRFHMPGHKGEGFLGIEKYDITEIDGADVLSQAEGIINQSEENASSLFSSAHTFYVTQGSTTAICAMLALMKKSEPQRTVILAARNVHKAFVNACALLDIDARWLMPDKASGVLECRITAEDVEKELEKFDQKPDGVYLTSPDYLGNMQDICGIAKVCRKFGVPLIVDNAHGAYLKFLEKSQHPIDLGADLCCDSAHKTLPVLTGGAYLHVSKNAPAEFVKKARGKIGLFSSTSPSYLILQSLDLCNAYLDDGYREALACCISEVDSLKQIAMENGFVVMNGEPLKLVIDAKKSGYSTNSLAKLMRENCIEPEFFDDDYMVLMVTPHNKKEDFERLKKVFLSKVERTEKNDKEYFIGYPEKRMTIRQAVLAEWETVDVSRAEGRICAELTVSCPPAVPIAVSGEAITRDMICLFEKYGIREIKVVK
ncbi:MAG: aminotransferase class V-fold PLP-dependent enzyme [Clostridia bacterium]|nr:aminotransferase class V-fold PLP-dependent enzyme [Clostridia bacterium]